MEGIKKMIKIQSTEMDKILKRQSTLRSSVLLRTFSKIKVNYEIWLERLQTLTQKCLYRQVIKEIELKKNNFSLLSKELWKYRLIKANAILHLIKIKMRKHSKEIVLENSNQNYSIRFWFNQIFITLEQLILEFRPDLNRHLNYDDKNILIPIEKIIDYFLEFIYYLSIFSLKAKQIAEMCVYLSIGDRFLSFTHLLNEPKSFHYLQNLLLLKTKILISNCNYHLSFDYLRIINKLCYQELIIFFDNDTNLLELIKNNQIKNVIKSKNDNKFYTTILNILLCFYLKGVMCEHLGYLNKATKNYQICQWLTEKFIKHYDKNICIFFNEILNKSKMYLNIFSDMKFIAHNKKEKDINENKQNIINNKNNTLSNIKKNNSTVILKTKENKLLNNKKLFHYLDTLGKNLYKEEEERNHNSLNGFNKKDYILSTVNLLDNLLTDDFSYILKKMKKIEFTRPDEDIDWLINKEVFKKRQKLVQNHFNQLSHSSNSNSQNKKKTKKKTFSYCNKKTNNNNIIINSYDYINKDFNNNNESFSYKRKDKNKVINSFIKDNKNINLVNKDKEFSFTERSQLKDNCFKINNNTTNKITRCTSSRSFFLKKEILLSQNQNKEKKLDKKKLLIYRLRTNSSNKSFNNYYNNTNNSINKYYNNTNINEINANRNLNIYKKDFDKNKKKIQNYLKSKKVKVTKYPIDKDIFNTLFSLKKKFINSFYDKELNFQKNLLKIKKYEKIDKPDEKIDYQKINLTAEKDFDRIYSISEISNKKKNLLNLLFEKDFDSINQESFNTKSRKSILNHKKKIISNYFDKKNKK